MNDHDGLSPSTNTSCARVELEAALLEAIWHAWFYGDRDATAALTDSLRTARNQQAYQVVVDVTGAADARRPRALSVQGSLG